MSYIALARKYRPKNFKELVLVVIEKLSALVAAATDSTHDILGVLKILTYFRSAYP